MKDTRRALEIWMATIGAGITVDRRDDVRDIWKLLEQSKPYLDTAMDEILADENKTSDMVVLSYYELPSWLHLHRSEHTLQF